MCFPPNGKKKSKYCSAITTLTSCFLSICFNSCESLPKFSVPTAGCIHPIKVIVAIPKVSNTETNPTIKLPILHVSHPKSNSLRTETGLSRPSLSLLMPKPACQPELTANRIRALNRLVVAKREGLGEGWSQRLGWADVSVYIQDG